MSALGQYVKLSHLDALSHIARETQGKVTVSELVAKFMLASGEAA
jgi:hypothetical protein